MVSIAFIGPGLVGSECLVQLKDFLSSQCSLVAICNSRKALLSLSKSQSISLDRWKSLLAGSSTDEQTSLYDFTSVQDFVSLLSEKLLIDLNDLILMDCTASGDVAATYPWLLSRGISIVTPNKKAFSSNLNLWKEIQHLTHKNYHTRYPLCYHESSVGAGLPIISTLKDLVATGDEIIRIEGVLSGTLSYIFNTYCGGSEKYRAFSEIVMEAKKLGYTEPDPRDDLNGVDVARKVIILGRVSGVDLEMDKLSVENIVPEALRSVASGDEFLKELPKFDQEFESLKKEAEKEAKVLRYVGVVDVKDKQGSVKIMSYPLSHPFAQLKGSDNIIAIYTERFKQPLIVQGAGAGAAVTAHGVVSDVIKVAEILSNRYISNK